MNYLSKIRRLMSYGVTALLAVVLYHLWTQEHVSFSPTPSSDPGSLVKHSSFVPNTFRNTNRPNLNTMIDTAKKVEERKTISVKTDVLYTEISLLDGNIVSASLLKYPEQSGKPTRILQDGKDSVYYAQSGFTNMGHIEYNSKLSHYTFLPGSDSIVVELNGKVKNGLLVCKRFIFDRNSYSIQSSYTVKNNTSQTWSGSFFNQLVRQKPEEKGHSLFYTGVYDGGALSNKNTIYKKLTYSDMSKNNVNTQVIGGWVAMQQHYFLSAWVPQTQDQKNAFYSNVNNDIYTLGFSAPEVFVAPNQEIKTYSTLYIGPEIAKDLKKIAPGLDRTIDYGWLWWISISIFWLMDMIHGLVGNWGWSIVLTTIVIKFILYPLSAASFRSMARMRELQPKMQQLKERFSDDRQAMSRATMELYRKEKINPLGGCLPVLIQIPIFIGLYYVIIESVQLRQAPFIFWIHDLSVKDPYYVLPVLMGLSMLLQQKLTPSSLDPMQAKVMMFIPIVFTFFFFAFPSGLTLYWFINNCMQILQQYFVAKVSHKNK